MLNRVSDFVLNRFPLFIFCYFVLQILIRVITTNGVEIDESEQMMLSQYFSLGYNAQPPLYTWVQRIFFNIFGENIFAISSLKNFLLFSTYIFTYKTGLLITKNKKVSALSAFSLFFLPQIVWEAQIDQIHTVLLTTSTAALFYFYFYTLKKQNLTGFILIGLASACGVLAKYNFVLVALALMVATLFVADYRKKIFTKKLIVSVSVTTLLVLPHLLWFLSNKDLATLETMQRMSLDQNGSYFTDILHGIVELIISYLAFVIPFLIFYIALFRNSFIQKFNRPSKVLANYILISFISIFVIILIMQVTNIKERWLQPYLYIAPLLAFMLTDIKSISQKKINVFISTGLFFCSIVILMIPLRVMFVDMGKKPHRANYPFEQLSEEIKSIGFDKGLILTEDKFIGGNLKLFLNDSTIISPSIPLQKFKPEEKVLIVWQTRNPINFLKGLNLKESSGVVQKDIPFRYSKKFTYDISFQVYTYDGL
ncbi:MAG: glycosyltransferase family 39 protein [Deltaproteobacteria bacterium]|uniref:ArnT family glycosyltransferase n=1 Tax=Desulfobacula sp. TaxID=2593537 RepID=UPI0019B3FDCD|nr:glycosyltransferase family 39 protein [Candidatus Desulfobacula maris]MBL6993969.1 glycosyltransferase family 39 protein [Desulfobacula sp.]